MLKQLVNDGFKYLYIPKGNHKRFYVHKSEDFYNDEAEYSEFKAVNKTESKILKVLPKNAFLPLEALL